MGWAAVGLTRRNHSKCVKRNRIKRRRGCSKGRKKEIVATPN